MAFVDLHLHTEYSLRDAIGKIKDIVAKEKELGRIACAITDHGVGYGLVEFYNECKKQGIKPILGCEFYEAHGSRFEKSKTENNKNYYHLIILVKNEIGYKNLCKLITRSNTEGFYYKPRIDMELLKEFHEGLICLSACIAGKVPQDIIRDDFEKAKADIEEYRSIFGEDFYLEIQNHGITEEAIVAHELYKFGKEMGIKVVCTNDCHYVNSEDAKAHEWMLCVERKTNIHDPNRTIYYGDYSIKSEEDMRSLFPSMPEVFDNTIEVADKCNFDLKFAEKPSDYLMPPVEIPESFSTDDSLLKDCAYDLSSDDKYFNYLKSLSLDGLNKRYPITHAMRQEAIQRLAYELSVIKQMGFAQYFLDIRRTIINAKSKNIPVGPGRGSGAGSLLNYCVDITDIEPLRYNLLFERFLNPERISMPDIDTDFCYAYQDTIVKDEADYIGRSNFCKIQTFQSSKAKAILRDCARVAGMEASVGTQLSKCVPEDSDDPEGIRLQDAYNLSLDLQNLVNSSPEMYELWTIALKLERLKKSASTHACGHIALPVPCEDLFPCSVDGETGFLICQYNMSDAEHLGNLKKDLLMLRNLDIIDVARKLIKQRRGIDVPLWTSEILDDKETFNIFKTGDTNGVFQFESAGMKKFLKDLKPDCFEDLIAAVSLYRPGPMDYIPEYIKNKRCPQDIVYDSIKLESILKPTYGVIVYQEQVMQIVRELAGFSMGRADVVRKAMGQSKDCGSPI